MPYSYPRFAQDLQAVCLAAWIAVTGVYILIYTNFKKGLLQQLETVRDLTIARSILNRPEPLFEISTADDKMYIRILQAFEVVAIQKVEELIQNLCNIHGIANSVHTKYGLCVNVSGERKFIEIKSSPLSLNSDSIHKLVYQQKERKDSVCVVFLIKDEVKARTQLRRFCDRIHRIDNTVKIEAVIFEDFLESLFGEKERNSFFLAMRTFKEEMHQAIGYQITEICSPRNREKLKTDLLDELREFNYCAVRDELYERDQNPEHNKGKLEHKTFKKILNNYLSQGLYSMMVGSKEYANSFLTSEWLLKKYCTLDELDNTFIVAGYLKSIEQLLWEIIRIVGKGRLLRDKVISEENNDCIDTTLGSLEYFLSDNGNSDLFRDVFGVSKHYVIKYLRTQLRKWRITYRNGYFHKDQLKDRDRIETIRREAIYLYMLILGSLDLSGIDISMLTE